MITRTRWRSNTDGNPISTRSRASPRYSRYGNISRLVTSNKFSIKCWDWCWWWWWWRWCWWWWWWRWCWWWWWWPHVCTMHTVQQSGGWESKVRAKLFKKFSRCPQQISNQTSVLHARWFKQCAWARRVKGPVMDYGMWGIVSELHQNEGRGGGFLNNSRVLVEYSHSIHHQGVHGIILPCRQGRIWLTVLNPILPSQW